MRTKERLRPGTIITLPDIEYMADGDGRQKKVMRKYRVLHHHEHCCIVENAFGIRRGPSNAELMQMGILTQQF